MFAIIIDGLVLLGLMYVFDRNNPHRDFLETGAVAFFLIIAGFLLNRFLGPLIGVGILIPYLALSVLLLWKFVGMTTHKAVLIGATFVIYKVAESYIAPRVFTPARLPVGAIPASDTCPSLHDVAGLSVTGQFAPLPGPDGKDLLPGVRYVSFQVDGQRSYWNEARDAVPFLMPDLDPKDIESLEFLQPDTARSRYGTCEGVGLILITTKSGTHP